MYLSMSMRNLVLESFGMSTCSHSRSFPFAEKLSSQIGLELAGKFALLLGAIFLDSPFVTTAAAAPTQQPPTSFNELLFAASTIAPHPICRGSMLAHGTLFCTPFQLESMG